MVEIAQWNSHRLTDCESRSQFRECQRCREAILTQDFDQHIQALLCSVSDQSISSRCPLCHSDIPSGDEVGGWVGVCDEMNHRFLPVCVCVCTCAGILSYCTCVTVEVHGRDGEASCSTRTTTQRFIDPCLYYRCTSY